MEMIRNESSSYLSPTSICSYKKKLMEIGIAVQSGLLCNRDTKKGIQKKVRC